METHAPHGATDAAGTDGSTGQLTASAVGTTADRVDARTTGQPRPSPARTEGDVPPPPRTDTTVVAPAQTDADGDARMPPRQGTAPATAEAGAGLTDRGADTDGDATM
eukprot:gene1980-824_t